MNKRKCGFTLIELIGVLVIFAIITLIVTPLVMNIIRKAKISARKRSVDAYGRSVELAIASYLLDTGKFPTNEQLPNLKIEYSGNKVECNVMNMKKNGGLYLSQCKVNNIDVKDSNEEDGYYHYGARDLTNSEIIEMYASSIKNAVKEYHDENNAYPSDLSELTIDYTGENVSCDVEIYGDGAIYMTKCSISGIEMKDDTDDGYYHYGTKREKLIPLLLSKTNDISITNYTDGNTHEMYTFNHSATTQTEALTDYRYIGNTPNNYVTFNNELWRIIGVFTVEDENGNQEQRIKIVRNEKLSTDMAWDSISPYENEWPDASLNVYLNEEYLNDFSEISRRMVVNTIYYLGGRDYNSTTHCGTAEDMYAWERGIKVYNERSLLWNGNIALMYPSDYTYTYALGIDNICYNDVANCYTSQGGIPTKSWIHNTNSNSLQWLLSPTSNFYGATVLTIRSNGGFDYNGVVILIGVRPTLYLVSDVKIDSGEGTEQSPYQLKL